MSKREGRGSGDLESHWKAQTPYDLESESESHKSRRSAPIVLTLIWTLFTFSVFGAFVWSAGLLDPAIVGELFSLGYLGVLGFGFGSQTLPTLTQGVLAFKTASMPKGLGQPPEGVLFDSESDYGSLVPKVNRFNCHTIPRKFLRTVGSVKSESEMEMSVEETIIQSVQIDETETETETLVTFLKLYQESSAAGPGVEVDIEKIELQEGSLQGSAPTDPQ